MGGAPGVLGFQAKPASGVTKYWHNAQHAGSVQDPPYRHSSQVKEAKMPGTLRRIRDEMDVKPTPRDKGLTLTLRVTAYDNGMIEVDGVPINEAPAYDPGHGWLGAAETALLTISEFRRQAERRRKQKAAGPK